MTISVVIPNFNGEKLLKNNLPKVLEVVGNAEVIVVDDASKDKSIEIIKNLKVKIKNAQRAPDVKLKIIKNNKNLGFASTVNRGVKEATGELIVLLNTDVVPEAGFLTPLTSHFSDPKVFAAGFLQRCPENGKVILRGRGIGEFRKGFLIHDRGAIIGEDTSEVYARTPRMVEESKKTLWISGGAGMFRKSIWNRLGGLDTLYNPFYWEDIDLSYRAQKAGYKLVFEPKSIVTHSQEKGAIRGSYAAEQIKTIAYRNQILFVWLNITDMSLLIQHIIYLPYHLLRSILTSDFSFIKGLMSAIRKLPQAILHRLRNKKLNLISDKMMLQNFSGKSRKLF